MPVKGPSLDCGPVAPPVEPGEPELPPVKAIAPTIATTVIAAAMPLTRMMRLRLRFG